MTCGVSLDRRITIQYATTAQDGYGEPVKTWATFAANVPAEFIPVSGREFFAAKQVNAEAVARFRIRFRSDLTRQMRVVYDGETYDIEDIQEDRQYDRRQYLRITGVARPA